MVSQEDKVAVRFSRIKGYLALEQHNGGADSDVFFAWCFHELHIRENTAARYVNSMATLGLAKIDGTKIKLLNKEIINEEQTASTASIRGGSL